MILIQATRDLQNLKQKSQTAYKDMICDLRVGDGEMRTNDQRDSALQYLHSMAKQNIQQTIKGHVLLTEPQFLCYMKYKQNVRFKRGKKLWRAAMVNDECWKGLEDGVEVVAVRLNQNHNNTMIKKTYSS